MNCHKRLSKLILFLSFAVCGVVMSACTSQAETAQSDADNEANGNMLTLPELTAVNLNHTPLKVVAGTSIIGDVVAQVGSDAIQLTTLMGPGQDPHSYEPGAQTLTAVSKAHVIFLNGWDLEETLARNLETISGSVPVVLISANIEPLAFGEDVHTHTEDTEAVDEHQHGAVDPHVWFSIPNVKQWVENVQIVLIELDPNNADIYQANAQSYLAELDALAAYATAELAAIPAENRYLVTNHDAFGYFAHEYNFEVVGTVIPGMSTMAEPSAGDLSGLIAEMERHHICTIFTETTVSAILAQTVANELEGCTQVQVTQLYTGAIGPAGSGADSYIGMFRANVDAIVSGLQ